MKVLKKKPLINKLKFLTLLLTLNLFPIVNVIAENLSKDSDIEENINDETSKVDYIRWYGVYDGFPQIDLKLINESFYKLIEKGSVDMNRDAIVELIGEPSESYEVGTSEFLLYYSMNDTESAIMYVQLFSEELAAEASETADIESMVESEASSTENEYKEPYLAEVSKLIVNERDFQELSITEDEVIEWQEADEDDREFTTIDELVDRIGFASEELYNFQNETWLYNWYRDSESVEGLSNLSATFDKESLIQSLDVIEVTEEE